MFSSVKFFGGVFVWFFLSVETQAQSYDFSKPEVRKACVSKILESPNYQSFDDLVDLDADSFRAGGGDHDLTLENACNFSILSAHEKISVAINSLLQSSKSNVTPDSTQALSFFANQSEKVARQMLEDIRGEVTTSTASYSTFPGMIGNYATQLSYHNLSKGGSGYDPALLEVKSAFTFEIFDENVNAQDKRKHNVSYNSSWKFNSAECNLDCRAYIELYVFSLIWNEVWAENASATNFVALETLSKSKKKYDNYFFETGDGLYPWELLVNNLAKGNDMLEPPKFKFNLVHPTPVILYSDTDGNVDPRVIVEVIGITKVNYESELPFGAALAVDFKDDDLRYGAVVHLPIEKVVESIAGESVSKFVPCTVCSVAFLTDGDQDWSVGLKIDIAKLLFNQDDLAPDLLSSLFD